MSAQHILGVEGGSLARFNSTVTSGGTISADATIKRSGAYSLKSSVAGNGTAYAILDNGLGGSIALASVWISFYIYITTAPGSASEQIFKVIQSSSTLQKVALRLNSTRTLSIENAHTSVVATGSVAIPLTTWTRVDLICSNGSSQAYEVRIDEGVDISGSGLDMRASDIHQIYIGRTTDSNGQTTVLQYDDLVVDNAAYAASGYKVLKRSITANGSATTATVNTGSGALWEVADEIPNNGDTDGMITGTSTGDAYLATMESCATVGISGTILAQAVYATLKQNIAAARVQLRQRSGSTNSDSGNIDPGTSYVEYGFALALDPSTGAAWNTSGLDPSEIGFEQNAAVLQSIITNIFAEVAFVAAVASAFAQPRIAACGGGH